MMDIRQELENAIGTGQLLGIVYHGGSQPGAYREIMPLQVVGVKVRARCYTSNAVKEFMLEKIELRGPVPTSQDKAIEWRTDGAPQPTFADIRQVYEASRQQLTAAGWIVEFESYDGGEAIWLKSAFKNGRVKKNADVSLQYEAMISDAAVQPDGSITEENLRPRSRPWIVRSKSLATAKTYGSAASAVQEFLNQAATVRPT